jgi:hypothetical protein
MNYFYEPVNLKQWNMFDKVSGPGHLEPFLATQKMKIGDIVLLHVGTQDPEVMTGVYAWGVVKTMPEILLDEDRKDIDYCYGKLSVWVEVKEIVRSNPLIKQEDCRNIFNNAFRSVHKINEKGVKHLLKIMRF